ncbi:MAG: hypothetical protein KIS88_05875 [Anaerolineales bacterium]|nr:hypothetical protein [Anaerolineales bacterium]
MITVPTKTVSAYPGFAYSTKVPFEAKGSLIAVLHDGVTVLDIAGGLIKSFPLPENCSPFVVPQSTEFVCKVGEDFIMYDALSGVEKPLDDLEADWISATKNGKFLFYGYQTEKLVVGVIDTSSGEHVSQGQIDISEVYSGPWSRLPYGSLTLSPDGKYFAFLAHSNSLNIADVVIVSAIDYSLIAVENMPAIQDSGAGLAWSYDGRYLLYGSQESAFAPEIWADEQYLFEVADSRAAFVRELQLDLAVDEFWSNRWWIPGDLIPPGNNFLADVWSPDNEHLVLSFSRSDESNGVQYILQGFCITKIIGERNLCKDIVSQTAIDTYYSIDSLGWSPRGDFVYFVARGSRDTDVFIYSIERDEFFLILSESGIVSVEWIP